MFSCENCEIFKSTRFEEYLRTTAVRYAHQASLIDILNAYIFSTSLPWWALGRRIVSISADHWHIKYTHELSIIVYWHLAQKNVSRGVFRTLPENKHEAFTKIFCDFPTLVKKCNCKYNVKCNCVVLKS